MSLTSTSGATEDCSLCSSSNNQIFYYDNSYIGKFSKYVYIIWHSWGNNNPNGLIFNLTKLTTHNSYNLDNLID